ncbi:ATP-binding protein [Microlunatus soli]|uniref:Signal transduction histidine kinase n=1 Tax=Microlunatus soli TaxID=630515 RepID=A0A1H1WZC8_9ACTN|nr:ATP-binding protein [Microlunatus soli]SDT02405.1 Signal transduction histidine kinase [Microlunatus soli]
MTSLGAHRTPDTVRSGSDPLRPADATDSATGSSADGPDKPETPAAPEADSPTTADRAGADEANSAGPTVRDKVLQTASRKQAEQEAKEQRPRATRVSEGALLGGVCTGLARHLGWPVMVLRVGFVALALTQFVGVIAYGALWLLMPPETAAKAPGLEAASRQGMRVQISKRRRADWGALLALIVLGAGLIWIVQISGLGIKQQVFWPVAFACAGAALVWRQADTARQREWKTEAGGRVWLAPLIARGGWPAVIRVVIGLTLVGAAFGIVVAQQNQLQQLPEVLAMTVLALAGLAIVAAPWLHRSRTALNEARAAKVRADARADMAAHLHDSVLQTLALIQRQSDDPKEVQRLARRQERELRTWLYGEEVTDTTLKAALATAAAEVEDERGIPVELITVGDCELTEPMQAMIRAAREAIVNAAKHSGADKIDVFAEATEDLVEIFVRDRGSGFDAETIDEDRMGVRGSIIGRMTRHGGTARIRSAPGEGTEVRLEMQR